MALLAIPQLLPAAAGVVLRTLTYAINDGEEADLDVTAEAIGIPCEVGDVITATLIDANDEGVPITSANSTVIAEEHASVVPFPGNILGWQVVAIS